MNDDFIKNNPAFSGMDPQKLQFLLSFANMDKPKNLNQAMPFLISQMNLAKRQDINFTKSEVSLLCDLLSADLPENEKKKIQKVLKLLQIKS